MDRSKNEDEKKTNDTSCVGHVAVAEGQDLQKVKVTLDTGEDLPLVGFLCDKARNLPNNLPVLDGIVNGVVVDT